MSAHWWYVTAAWGAAGLVLGALCVSALARHAAARRALAALDGGGGERRRGAAS